MAIAIPSVIDAQLLILRNSLLPNEDAVTKTGAFSVPPYAQANRVADIVRALTGLMDAGPLVATGGSTATVQDTGAFTGVNSLVGCKVIFEGNVTAAIANHYAFVSSNDANTLTFDKFFDSNGNLLSALPGAVAAGDNYSIEFSAIDKDLVALEQGKGLGDSASNPYGPGPNLINLGAVLLNNLTGSIPAYLTVAAAEPFGLGSPHAGGNGVYGHAGAIIISTLLQEIRDAVAAYTAPA